MLRRQKLLLAILHASKRVLTPIEIVKLAFLLRYESEVGTDHTYYDFVPYRFGPFSFALYRELETLHRDGYLELSESSIGLSDSTRPDVVRKIGELRIREQKAVTGVITQFGRLKQESLVREVYTRYPWFTINSEMKHLIPESQPKRPRANIAIYTSGYEGKSVDGFFDKLIRTGVRLIIDVRYNPVSRKYGFAGSSLKRIGEKLGFDYTHLPELGIAGEDRESLSDFGSYQRLLDRYTRNYLVKQESTLSRLADILRKKPSVLVCMEKNVDCCHRGRLANAMAARMNLPVVHL